LKQTRCTKVAKNLYKIRIILVGSYTDGQCIVMAFSAPTLWGGGLFLAVEGIILCGVYLYLKMIPYIFTESTDILWNHSGVIY